MTNHLVACSATTSSAPGSSNRCVAPGTTSRAASTCHAGFVADPETGRITDRVSRGNEPVLSDRLIRELANVGVRIEDALGSPQDIEFAIDRDNHVAIVQSRPITTLYPLPADGLDDAVYFSVSVAQGYFDPITPMGNEAFLAIGRQVVAVFARGDAAAPVTPRSPLVVAGLRPFVDVTPVLRDQLGREVLERMASIAEARSSVVFRKLGHDPRFRPRRRLPFVTLARVLPLVVRSRTPLYALRLLQSPARRRARILREVERATPIPRKSRHDRHRAP